MKQSKLNYSLPIPEWVGWLLIVPINQTNIQGLPAFDVFEVKTGVAWDSLVKELSIDLALLKLHYGLGDGEILRSGEWALVSHVSTPTL